MRAIPNIPTTVRWAWEDNGGGLGKFVEIAQYKGPLYWIFFGKSSIGHLRTAIPRRRGISWSLARE